MKLLRRPWMIRAAFAVIGVGVLLIAFSIVWMWLYREIADIAPDWMTARRRGGLRASYFELAGLTGYTIVGGISAVIATLALFRFVRVPDEVFSPPPRSSGYPFHGRELSPAAQIQAGQEGYVGAKLDQLAEVVRSPLTPPPRKRD